MKRSRTIFGVIAVVAGALVSCNKTEPVPPATEGSATISGIITADLIQWNDTITGPIYIPQLYPEFPSNKNIIWTINEFFLDPNPDPTFAYQNRSGSVAISSTNGTYSITVPAISSVVPVTLYFDDYNYNQAIFYAPNPDSVVYDGNDLLKVNGGTSVTINVVAGGSFIYNDIYQ